MYKSISKKIIFILGGMVILLGLKFYNLSHKPKLELLSGNIVNPPRVVKPFSLEGSDQQNFNSASLCGQWTIIFYGFTSCGSLCPTTLAELSRMYRLLEEKNHKILPRVVLISIDPERDSLDRLKKYVSGFNINFYAAKGDSYQLKKMTKEFGLWFEKQEASSENIGKDINHSGTIYLIDPVGKLIAFFTPPHNAELLAKDFSILASNYKSSLRCG